jgi:outer membrane immunogenic protein
MNKLLIGSAALAVLIAGPAMAADLPPAPAVAPMYKAPVFVPAFSWTGFYVGADGGYGWGNSSGTLADAAGAAVAPYSYGANGPIAGGFVGGNYQINQFVLGVEADWQWADLTGNSGALPSGHTMSSTVKDYGSLRGRLGFAVDRFLIFGTGGWAWGNWSTSYAVNGFGPFYSNNASSTSGWTAGAGVEYAFTNNIIGRVEYRYTDLGSSSYTDVATNSSELGNKVTINDIRAGVSFKFGGF